MDKKVENSLVLAIFYRSPVVQFEYLYHQLLHIEPCQVVALVLFPYHSPPTIIATPIRSGTIIMKSIWPVLHTAIVPQHIILTFSRMLVCCSRRVKYLKSAYGRAKRLKIASFLGCFIVPPLLFLHNFRWVVGVHFQYYYITIQLSFSILLGDC